MRSHAQLPGKGFPCSGPSVGVRSRPSEAPRASIAIVRSCSPRTQPRTISVGGKTRQAPKAQSAHRAYNRPHSIEAAAEQRERTQRYDTSAILRGSSARINPVMLTPIGAPKY